MKNVRREDWETLKPTVYGWGINDVNYKVQLYEEVSKVGGRKKLKCEWVCPYYVDWKSIIMRCFCPKTQKINPTYKGCSVSNDWKYLSNFIKWVDSQPNRDWQNCSPDKDLLSEKSKVYGPETVVYISKSLNSFITDRANFRGDSMLGVSPRKGKYVECYQARCCNPFKRKRDYLGSFITELEAHKAWQAKKHEYACQLADLQDDPRVAEALRQRYSPDKDWTRR